MKKKIVLMKNVKYNYEVIKEINDDFELNYWLKDGEHVMLTELVDVEFMELKIDEVVKSEVAIIDKQIIKVNADAQAALTALEGRKQELLAISHFPEISPIDK